jgi:hypothetical protein
MKFFDPAPKHVHARVEAMIAKYHHDLEEAAVKVDLVYTHTDQAGKPALLLHGWPCYAVVRIISLKDRAMGRGDAEIVIDKVKYEAMTTAQQDALLDHELQHLKTKVHDDGEVMRDSRKRPKLQMVEHDREYGWFDVIAERHGEASIEVQQSRLLQDQAGQLYFKFPAPVAA